jgi:cyclopropane-fatty-acyl-phospholipid synthase
MGFFTLEHSARAYRADFAFYAIAVGVFALVLVVAGPHARWLQLSSLALGGLAGWSAIEYGLHRFVLHGVQPFRGWHAAHHQRPAALICAPTLLSASLIAGLVFLPAWWCADVWLACALTLGLLSGYLGYAVTHHATHHWRGHGVWLKQRKRWHGMHHHLDRPACYGVTSSLWDHVFGSTGRPAVSGRWIGRLTGRKPAPSAGA